ncbi:hypothetical protein GCM10010517_56760 [Streptosporangium fragile]|uniref:Uncharacterized protein n=1 Tax=Streptosporangium fragile TaxID=46186 RepID=A0ABN3W5P3_9ACTN
MWSAPDLGSGSAIELSGGQPGDFGDLIGVGEGLPGQSGLAEDPPPALLQVEPARADWDERMRDSRVLFQSLTGGLAVV